MHDDDRKMSLWLSAPAGCCVATVLMVCVIMAVFVLDYFLLPALFSYHLPPTLGGFMAPAFWLGGVALAAYYAASQGRDSPWKSSLLVGSIALAYLVVADRPNSEEFSKIITLTGRSFAFFVVMSVMTIPAAFAGGLMHAFLSSRKTGRAIKGTPQS